MATKIITGSIFDAQKGSVIIQQVNACNRMNSGVARAIFEKYPKVKKDYHDFCEGKTKEELMGQVYFTETEHYTFYGFVGQMYDRKVVVPNNVYTDIVSVKKGLQTIAADISKDRTIVIPYNMSCDLAGGDWNEVLALIESIFKDFEVEIYKLEQKD